MNVNSNEAFSINKICFYLIIKNIYLKIYKTAIILSN